MDPHFAELWGLLSKPSPISKSKAKQLISRCVDLNWVTSTGDTLLTAAAINRHASVVELLIEAKVEVNRQAKGVCTFVCCC
jgi:hypothetical protein